MTYLPRVPRFAVGDPGTAADVQGLPSMLIAQQPDSAIDAGVAGALTIRAASVRGVGHRYDATSRQDDFCMGLAGPGDRYLVAIVADGVSAGPRSHLAARVAVRLGVQLVTEALATGPPEAIDWDALVGTIAGHVLLQARKDAGDETLDAHAASRIMASTVAFVVVPVEGDADCSRACTVLPFGDTSVWVLRSGTMWESITHVKNDGEPIASSAVLALPLLPPNPMVALSAVLGAGDALFVVTDGIGDPLGDGSGQVGDALAVAWRSPPNRYEFAAQVDFGRRSHTDDRTVVGIWPDLPDDREALPLPIAEGEAVPAVIDLAPAAVSAPIPAAVAVPVAVDSPPTDPTTIGPGAMPAVEPLDSPVIEPTTWEPTPWEPTPWTPGPDVEKRLNPRTS